MIHSAGYGPVESIKRSVRWYTTSWRSLPPRGGECPYRVVTDSISHGGYRGAPSPAESSDGFAVPFASLDQSVIHEIGENVLKPFSAVLPAGCVVDTNPWP